MYDWCIIGFSLYGEGQRTHRMRTKVILLQRARHQQPFSLCYHTVPRLITTYKDCSEMKGRGLAHMYNSYVCPSSHTLLLQCATHLNLGWRILVLNEGDPIPPRSVGAPSVVASLLTVLLIAMTTLFLWLLFDISLFLNTMLILQTWFSFMTDYIVHTKDI